MSSTISEMSERIQNRRVMNARSGIPLWQESESFSKERDRLESYFHRLQSQRVRLEQCLTVALPPPPPSSSSLSPSSEPVQRGDSSSSNSNNSSSPSKNNNNNNSNSDSSSGIDNSPRTNNTTLRAAVDDAAAAALAESSLPTATWSSSFYSEFWRETSQQRLSYVEEKNLAGTVYTHINSIHTALLTRNHLSSDRSLAAGYELRGFRRAVFRGQQCSVLKDL